MYAEALQEVKNGHNSGHWVWYVFPQMKGLGKSEISQFYGINEREEAKAYIAHPILRERLVEISEAVLNNEKSVYEIFGNDAIKVRSCHDGVGTFCDSHEISRPHRDTDQFLHLGKMVVNNYIRIKTCCDCHRLSCPHRDTLISFFVSDHFADVSKMIGNVYS